MGLAVLVLLACGIGWIHPFNQLISAISLLGLVLIILSFTDRPSGSTREDLTIAVVSVLVAIPLYGAVWGGRFLETTNDTLTYLAQAQWLQSHAFIEPAKLSHFYPIENQIYQYQASGSRMGASFFLGYIQALFGLRWSYDAYVATAGIALSAGCLAVGGILSWAAPIKKSSVLPLCVFLSASMNGFVFGAQAGFLPQTFGLSFLVGVVCLLPILIEQQLATCDDLKQPKILKFLEALPVSLCFSALIFTYNDILSYFIPATVLFILLYTYYGVVPAKRVAKSIFFVAIQTLLIVNVELLRVGQNFATMVLKAAYGNYDVGWQVNWSVPEFWAYTFGLKSPSPWPGWLSADDFLVYLIFPLVLVFIVKTIWNIYKKTHWHSHLTYLLCLHLTALVIFIKFRYINAGFNPEEIGHTFFQFKIASYLGATNIVIFLLCLSRVYLDHHNKWPIIRQMFFSCIAGFLVLQLVFIPKIYENHVKGLPRGMGFDYYLYLADQFSTVPNDEVIYLSGSPIENESMAYVLSEHKLAGKWDSGRLYVVAHENDRAKLEDADWLIANRNVMSLQGAKDQPGMFVTNGRPFGFLMERSQVSNKYAPEEGLSGERWWVDGHEGLIFTYRRVGSQNSMLIMEFNHHSAFINRQLSVEITNDSGQTLYSFKVESLLSTNAFQTPKLSLPTKFSIKITSDGENFKIAKTDPRIASFYITEFKINLVEASREVSH